MKAFIAATGSGVPSGPLILPFAYSSFVSNDMYK